MPTWEYRCIECELEFEELFISREEIKKHEKEYECPNCGSIAVRKPSLTNFTFKVKTPGNSGVHDIDYPSADKAVGRSAAKKWAKINKEQGERDAARKKFGTKALRKTEKGNYVPMTKDQLGVRETVLKTAKEAKESKK